MFWKNFLIFISLGIIPGLCSSQLIPSQSVILTSDSVVISGKQNENDILPGAGLIRVKDQEGKYSDFTHSAQGTVIRTNNGIFELFIGDEPTDIGTLSLRRNYHDQNSLGARMFIWDRDNVGNLELSSAELHNGIAEIKLNSNLSGATLNIVNEGSEGTIEFKIGNSVVGTFNQYGMQLKSYTTEERDNLVSVPIGTTIFNSTLGINEVWNGTAWN